MTRVIRKTDAPIEKTEWGSFQWLVSASNKASDKMTLGRVTFKPAQSNPSHHHPNCDEILFVVSGRIEHTLSEGGTVVLEPGDCIVLSQGGTHRATNVGSEEAVVIVAFNSAHRETIGES